MPRPFQRQAMTSKKNDYLYRRPSAQVPIWKKRWFLLLGFIILLALFFGHSNPETITPTDPAPSLTEPVKPSDKVTSKSSPEFDFYTQLTGPENSTETTEQPGKTLYILHVAQFKQPTEAQALLKKIQDIHITPYMIRTEQGYDVLIGPFSSQVGAQKIWSQLQSLALPHTIHIQRYPNPT